MKSRAKPLQIVRRGFVLLLFSINAAVFANGAEGNDNQTIVARRFGNAFQKIDWEKTSEEAARVAIEKDMQPTTWQFERFEMRKTTSDNPRLLSADLKGLCLNAAAWASALGKPYKLTLIGTDSLSEVVDPSLIESHIQIKDKNSFPISGMHYLLRGQPKFELMLFGKHHCLKTVIVQIK
jgi:hypothetical protein